MVSFFVMESLYDSTLGSLTLRLAQESRLRPLWAVLRAGDAASVEGVWGASVALFAAATAAALRDEWNISPASRASSKSSVRKHITQNPVMPSVVLVTADRVTASRLYCDLPLFMNAPATTQTDSPHSKSTELPSHSTTPSGSSNRVAWFPAWDHLPDWTDSLDETVVGRATDHSGKTDEKTDEHSTTFSTLSKSKKTKKLSDLPPTVRDTDPISGQRLRLLEIFERASVVPSAAATASATTAATTVNDTSSVPAVVVASVQSLLQPIPAKGELSSISKRITVGDSFDIPAFLEQLASYGFLTQPAVELPYEVAVRGGLIDLFTPNLRLPVRMEFFGDEIESLRFFDPATQRSTVPISSVDFLFSSMTPHRGRLSDFLPTGSVFLLVEPSDIQRQGLAYREQTSSAAAIDDVHTLFREIAKHPSLTISELAAGSTETHLQLRVESVDRFCIHTPNAWDDLDIRSSTDVNSVEKTTQNDSLDIAQNAAKRGETPPSEKVSSENVSLEKVSSEEVTPSVFAPTTPFNTSIYSRSIETIRNELSSMARETVDGEPQELWLVAPTSAEIHRISEIFAFPDTSKKTLKDGKKPSRLKVQPTIHYLCGTLSNGFRLPSLHTIVLSSTEMFGRTDHQKWGRTELDLPLLGESEMDDVDTEASDAETSGTEAIHTEAIDTELFNTNAAPDAVDAASPHKKTLVKSSLYERTLAKKTLDNRTQNKKPLEKSSLAKSPRTTEERQAAQQLTRTIDSFSELREGDYVVHVTQGIARYIGLVHLEQSGNAEDFLLLEFADRYKVYIPTSQIGLIQKYLGGSRIRPQLSKYNGGGWSRKKKLVEEAVSDLAVEMLEVAAQRNSKPGIAFPPDSLWQHEFEEAFPYVETEDQLTAITAIRDDMQLPRPMDRLLCGDVGFGKTELAIRAAFRAVEAGYQVAVLVPTTILAEQHFRTFCERMAAYPIHIAVLSRFVDSKTQKQVLTGLADGSIDVVIGTHRIGSTDIRFKNPGLIIIDEEQRFGVEVKERLKKMRSTVDILTMTATPIPRTLHQAVLGIRDISALRSPPRDRLAVETKVLRFDPDVVREAVLRELHRGGQIYFVHNRVNDIEQVATALRRIVPEARICVGHAQMPDEQLERVMLDFLNHRYDLLLATTIIESGLDIPTANTIFIDEANRYGLADLHQLRGRVGRYRDKAFCYLLLNPTQSLNPNALKRLRAIEEYSQLGSGFEIAMRDLEIRGAGNLLGTEQSGHIAAVGYEMYCQLLEQAVNRLRKLPPKRLFECEVHLPLHSFIPDAYVPGMRDRMDLYRRIARVQSLEEYHVIEEEFWDRFGSPPPEVQTLLRIVRIRLHAARHLITQIAWEPPNIRMSFLSEAAMRELMPRSHDRLRLVEPGVAFFVPSPSLSRRPIQTVAELTPDPHAAERMIDALFQILSDEN